MQLAYSHEGYVYASVWKLVYGLEALETRLHIVARATRVCRREVAEWGVRFILYRRLSRFMLRESEYTPTYCKRMSLSFAVTSLDTQISRLNASPLLAVVTLDTPFSLLNDGS